MTPPLAPPPLPLPVLERRLAPRLAPPKDKKPDDRRCFLPPVSTEVPPTPVASTLALSPPLPTLSRPDEPSDGRRRRSCRAFCRTSGMLRYDADRLLNPALPDPSEVPPPSHVIRPLLSLLRSSLFGAGGSARDVLRSMLDRWDGCSFWGRASPLALSVISGVLERVSRLFAYYYYVQSMVNTSHVSCVHVSPANLPASGSDFPAIVRPLGLLSVFFEWGWDVRKTGLITPCHTPMANGVKRQAFIYFGAS